MIDLYVINLDKRSDRWEKINHIFKNFNLVRVSAVEHNEGYIGCFMSHQKCLRYAKEHNMDYIIVLEDDCIPFETIEIFEERLNNIITYLRKGNYCDMLLGDFLRMVI